MSVLHLLLRIFQQHLTYCSYVTAMSMLNSKSEIAWPRRGWHTITRETLILKRAILDLTYNTTRCFFISAIEHSLRLQEQGFTRPRTQIYFPARGHQVQGVQWSGSMAHWPWTGPAPFTKSLGRVRNNNLLIGPGPLGTF